jgi:hypothetical protein
MMRAVCPTSMTLSLGPALFGPKLTIRAKGRLPHHPLGMMVVFPQQASIAGLIGVCRRIGVMRSRVVETTYLHDLYAEGLQPGQEPVQGGLIPQGAVQDRFDRLHGSAEPLEVKQGLGRENPDDADLVVGRRQRSPQLVAMGKGQYFTFSCFGPQRPMHYG